VGANLLGPIHGFMVWNLVLAAVPAVLAVALFPRRRTAVGGPGWWFGLLAWVLFLPNAPYVLTDVVHMVDDVRRSRSDAHAYVLVAIYGAFFTCGLASYAFSLQRLRAFLHRAGVHRLVAPALIVLHGASVIAMYLGRFVRLNSWDAVLAPQRVLLSVLRVPRPFTVVVLVVMFFVVGVGTFAAAAVGDKVAVHARRWKLL
jgi:uncharacterized membrane protein